MALADKIRMLRDLCSVPTGDPELARSQVQALSHQMPLLFAILIINSIALALTHARTAPLPLTTLFPALLTIACFIRTTQWLRARKLHMTGAQAIRRLQITMRVVPVLGMSFTFWALSLYPYGDAYARCHVAFYMAYTAMGCIFCLMHLRGAALMLMVVVLLPFTAFFLLTGNLVIQAIALNLLLVSFVMVILLLRNYADFTALILSKRELQARRSKRRPCRKKTAGWPISMRSPACRTAAASSQRWMNCSNPPGGTRHACSWR